MADGCVMEVGAAGRPGDHRCFSFFSFSMQCWLHLQLVCGSSTNFIFALVDDVRTTFYIVMFLNFNVYVYFMLIKF